MRAAHSTFAYLVLVSNLGAGLWGVVMWRRRHEPGRAFWITLAIAWISIYVQGAMGLAMFESRQPPFKHHFYGFLFAVITLSVFPVRGESSRRTLAVFSVATLFIGIVTVRAIMSGPP